jgi:tol-pal system protein YbgF
MSSWYRYVAIGLILALPMGAHAAQKAESLESRVDRMERLLDSKGLMKMMQRQMQLQEELDMLRGQNEVLQHEIKALKERQRELYLDMDRRIQEMGASGKTGIAPAAAAGAGAAAASSAGGSKPVAVKPVTPASAGGEPTQQEREAYKQAFERLKQGRYEASITQFKAFLKQYPSSGYASNAQYWLGEAYYVNKQYPQALEEFKKVVNKYPESSKVSDARLKLGFTYYELGNWEQARKTLKALSKDESGSSISRLADKRLQRMTQEGH